MQFDRSQTREIRDYVLTGLFIFLAIAMLISRHDGGLHNLRTASVVVMSYIEQPLSQVRVYREALQTNEELRRQNVRLMDELSRLRSAQQENEELRRLLDFPDPDEPELHPVRIVSKTLTGMNNGLTIDAGERHGVETGMPVVSPDGLIGTVMLTSRNYSQVLPFQNPMFRVSARVQGIRAYGVISWEGNRFDELVMDYVPQTINIENGSVIETSGATDQFPAYIPIGEVIRTEHQEGRDTQRIFIRPFVSLNEIAEGFVMKYTGKPEVDSLLMEYQTQFQ